jgi:putative aldouronate transport system substrate-binding protein
MKKLSRREMIKLMGISAAGVGLAACGGAAPAPTSPPAATAAPQATTAAQATDTTAPQATTAPAAATDTPAPTTAPAQGAPTKITMVESWFGVPQYKESIDPVTQAISQKLQSEGKNIEIQSMVLDDHANKYTVLYASGADFTMAFDAPWYKMTGLRDQGALLAIEGLVDQYGSNLKKEVTDKIYQKNFQNGHLYGIPAAYYYAGTTGVILREDLRQKYSAPAPTSEGGYASLEPFLQAVKKNNPELIPYALAPAYSINDANLWGRKAWALATNTGLIIPDWSKDTKLVNLEDVPQYIESSKLLRSWWQNALVNKEDLPSSGPSQNVQVDYIYPGKAASCQENEPEYKYVDETKSLQSSIKDGTLSGYDLTGMRAGKVRGQGALVQWNFIVFNANAPKDAQAAGIQYFDWLTTSQDNMDLWLMGVDGKNYKKESGLGFSEIPGVDAARNYRRQWYVSGLSGRFQRQPADLPQTAKDALTFFTTESNWDFNPHEQFSADTKAVEADLTKVNGVATEAFHGLNTGQMDTTAAIAQAKKMMDDAGRQTLRDKLQKQLDAYIAANPAK